MKCKMSDVVLPTTPLRYHPPPLCPFFEFIFYVDDPKGSKKRFILTPFALYANASRFQFRFVIRQYLTNTIMKHPFSVVCGQFTANLQLSKTTAFEGDDLTVTCSVSPDMINYSYFHINLYTCTDRNKRSLL